MTSLKILRKITLKKDLPTPIGLKMVYFAATNTPINNRPYII